MNENTKNIKTKEDFVRFVMDLSNDSRVNLENWQNTSIFTYLESVAAWTMENGSRYIREQGEEENAVNWELLATILFMGKIYE